ncbi:MAG TPA: response regulator [Candidatus Saccharimonadales bacterium]|nr:response regulator [Candidatus Saccharimonadales bacterium]
MNNGNILIVDDSDNIRNVLQMNFEWLGYDVRCAKDGEEALRIVRRESPDLIILDVMMPRRNGYQVCRTLKADERFREIPVVFLTAKDQEGDRFWGKDCGADEYLTKPFSAAKLEQVIARLIARRRRGEQVGDLTARIQALKADGRACTTIYFDLDSKALQVFRQKYGEIKFQEATNGVWSKVESLLMKEQPEALLGRDGENVMRAVLPCADEEAILAASRICMQTEIFLRGLYDREDAERGYVVTKLSSAGQEIHVPLLKVEATVKPETTEA